MKETILALMIYGLWAIILAGIVVAWRVSKVFKRETAPNAFLSGQQHGSDPYWRANRAHINTLENLPLFAAVALGGIAANVVTPEFGQAALVVAIARVAQSSIHLSSGSVAAVNLRFASYLVQLIALIWMVVHVVITADLI